MQTQRTGSGSHYSPNKGHQTPLNTKYSFICQRRLHRITSGFVFMPFFFFFLEGIYICIYLQPCRYLHSREYSVRNTKVLRKKLLKISSRLQENYVHMVRPESPVVVVQRQLGGSFCRSCGFRSLREQQAGLERWDSGVG